jgi:hypothetical protein
MGCHTRGHPAQKVAGDDHVGIGATRANRTFRSDAAGAHVAHAAATTRQAKGTVWLLRVEPIEAGVTSQCSQVLQHGTGGGVAGLGDDICLGWEGCAVDAKNTGIMAMRMVVLVMRTSHVSDIDIVACSSIKDKAMFSRTCKSTVFAAQLCPVPAKNSARVRLLLGIGLTR